MLMPLVKKLDRVGPFWVGVIFAILVANAVYLVQALIATWLPADPAMATGGGFIRGGEGFVTGGGYIRDGGFIRGNDFILFWTPANLAVRGEFESAYDVTAIETAYRQLIGPGSSGLSPWPYPPTYVLLMLPFGLLSFFSALALWQTLPLIGFMLVLSRLGLPLLLYWLIPLSASVVQTIVTGSNGLLMALLLAGGLLSLERHPKIAGVLFALVTIKPQLALLLGPALVIGGHWRALGAMVAAFAVLVGISLAAFGAGAWTAFFEVLSYINDQLMLGNVRWTRMPTILVAARMSGLDVTSAQLVQGVVALGAGAGVAWAWWHRVPFNLRAALLVAAILLTTPYAYDYDQVILLLPIAWLILEAQREPLKHLEIAAMVLVWMLPSWWMPALVHETGVVFGPVVLLAFYGMILNRAVRAQRTLGRGEEGPPRRRRAERVARSVS